MKHVALIVLLLLSASLLCRQAFALSDDERAKLFQEGIGAYQHGEFDRAVVAFDGMLADGFTNSEIYYNLGNAYYRQGHIGAAIAAYLNAERLAPRNGDLRYNLAFVRKQAQDKIEPRQSEAMMRTVFFWTQLLSRREWLWIFALSSALFWGCLCFTRKAAVVTGVVLAIAATGLAGRIWLREQDGVVTEPEIAVYSGPGQGNTQLFRLHEGAEFRITDRDNAWIRLTLPDGKQGWIESQFAKMVPVGEHI